MMPAGDVVARQLADAEGLPRSPRIMQSGPEPPAHDLLTFIAPVP